MKPLARCMYLLTVAAILCSLLGISAIAAESDTLWIVEASGSSTTAATVTANTTVTDGVICVHYDPQTLAYSGITVNDDWVAMYAINTDQAGCIKISWVAPNAPQPQEDHWLFALTFTGSAPTACTGLSGTVTGATVVSTPVYSAPQTPSAPEEDKDSADTGDNTLFLLPLLGVSLLGAVGMLFAIKRDGRAEV